jgi:hypothetical protein
VGSCGRTLSGADHPLESDVDVLEPPNEVEARVVGDEPARLNGTLHRVLDVGQLVTSRGHRYIVQFSGPPPFDEG